jgi:hypothetical protein
MNEFVYFVFVLMAFMLDLMSYIRNELLLKPDSRRCSSFGCHVSDTTVSALAVEKIASALPRSLFKTRMSQTSMEWSLRVFSKPAASFISGEVD